MIDNYEKLENGLIKQKSFLFEKKEYTEKYVKTYNSLGELSVRMSFLRLGFLFGAIQEKITKLLDVGYGNGDFLNCAKDFVAHPCGNEINGYHIPDGCEFVSDIFCSPNGLFSMCEKFDVVCFFDVLEHFDDIYEIENIKTKYMFISVPECHYYSDEWFKDWKHRKPDEHLWHFNKESLRCFMKEIGYELVVYSDIEDTIRKSESKESNILTGIFIKN